MRHSMDRPLAIATFGALVLALASVCAHEKALVVERFESMDAAAVAAALEIELRNTLRRRTVDAVEWSFNIFRDPEGYYPETYHTDNDPNRVTLRILPAAVASGHNHTNDAGNTVLCIRRPRECWRGDELSKGDLGEHGVLRALERAGRPLPHYLLTPTGKVKVWEWSAGESRWEVREVRPDGRSYLLASFIRRRRRQRPRRRRLARRPPRLPAVVVASLSSLTSFLTTSGLTLRNCSH